MESGPLIWGDYDVLAPFMEQIFGGRIRTRIWNAGRAENVGQAFGPVGSPEIIFELSGGNHF